MQEAFATNWVVHLGHNVNGFEENLEEFVNRRDFSTTFQNSKGEASG